MPGRDQNVEVRFMASRRVCAALDLMKMRFPSHEDVTIARLLNVAAVVATQMKPGEKLVFDGKIEIKYPYDWAQYIDDSTRQRDIKLLFPGTHLKKLTRKFRMDDADLISMLLEIGAVIVLAANGESRIAVHRPESKRASFLLDVMVLY